MPALRTLYVLFMLGLVAVPGTLASAQGFMAVEQPDGQKPNACLNRSEQRAAVAAKKAVPLAMAVKSLRERGRRAEVVRAELCNRDEKLVYVLTLLSRSGKVTRATIDAATGESMTAP